MLHDALCRNLDDATVTSDVTALWGGAVNLTNCPRPCSEILSRGFFRARWLKMESMVRATYSPPHRNKRQIGSQRSILTNFWKLWNLSWGSIHIIYCSTFTYLAKNLGDFWTYKKVSKISKTLSAWESGYAIISIYSNILDEVRYIY